MRTGIYWMAASMLIVSAGACRSSKADRSGASGISFNSWQAQPLVIDGSDSDWRRPLPYLDAAEKLTYSITHDADNLYIMISTRDPFEQEKIISGGITVWVNSQAEKTNDQAIGLGFPIDSRNNRERQLMAQAQPDRYKAQATTLDEVKEYELYGFSREEPIKHYGLGEDNKEGVKVGINYNQSGDLVYESGIPLRAIFPGKDPHYFQGREIAVGIFIEGVPAPPGGRRGGGGGGVGVGFGGGMGFGGYGSGMGLGLSIGSGLGRGGGRGGRSYKPKKIWQVLTLDRAAR